MNPATMSYKPYRGGVDVRDDRLRHADKGYDDVWMWLMLSTGYHNLSGEVT